MKRLLALILALIISLSTLVSCDIVNGIVNPDKEYGDEGDHTAPDDEKGDGDSDENSGEKPDTTPETEAYLYTDFATTEKNLLTKHLGEIIPFAPTNEYYFEGYYEKDDYENGINYYTIGNSYSDFLEYREMYSSYELYEVYTDEYGDTWYCYTKGNLVVDMSYYQYEGDFYIDVFACIDDSDDNGDDNIGGDNNNGNYTYTAFTSEERALLTKKLGEPLPFAPNNEYYVEEDYDEYYEMDCICFYTFGNTEADFESYRALYSAYTLVDTYDDEYGDTWYCYEKGDIYVEMSFYYYEGDYVIDVYAYYLGEESDNSGNTGGGNTDTNLPEGKDGVYNVDFTEADKVKDVTDQGYYMDGCPTTGSPAVLVIPVEFSDITAASKDLSIDVIESALLGDADYYNLYDYYYISSGGKLTLDIEILDNWFRPANTSSYYENATIDYYGDDIYAGDMLIIDEALDYLDDLMDLSKYDTDSNGIIDSIILVTTLDVGEDDFHWAYRYWNVYTDDEGYYYEYDGVSANDYLWMSCDFFYESTDIDGDIIYTDRSVVNTYTVIHEFGHILGLDDYYDTSELTDGPMAGLDMMDSMTGDHNPFSKFNLGWITTSRLVTGNTTLTLEKFSKNGDTIILANSFDPTLGAYQEYYVICYYAMDGLNGGEHGFFDREGILVYHINASLYSESYDGETYYDIANNNTDPRDEYGTENNLIEFVKSLADTYTYIAGDSMPSVTDDSGNILAFSFTVDSVDGDYATITFTKN